MKKSKLFLSLISLCFSLAVLCFGVYAANQVNYTIGGNITYNVSDAYIELNTMVYSYGESMPSSRAELKELADLFPDGTNYSSFSSIASSNNLTGVGSARSYNSLSGENSGVIVDQNTVTANNVVLNLNTTSNKAFVVVVNIKNLGDNNIYARLKTANFYEKTGVDTYSNVPMSSDDVVASNLMRYQTGGKPVIQKNQVVNLVYVFGIEDTTIGIDEMKIEYNFEIKNGAYTSSDLHFDSINNYYYVEMGEYNSESIRWRLVSVDGGLSKYTVPQNTTSQSSQPTGECVFLQETSSMINFETTESYELSANMLAYQNSSQKNGELFADYYAMQYNNQSEQYEYILSKSGEKIYANDYSVSTIRKWINGTNVYKYSIEVTQDISYRPDTTKTQSNMVTLYNLSNDPLYAKIQKRSLKDMYNIMLDAYDEENEVSYIGKCDLVTNNDYDKFWLLSGYECCIVLEDEEDLTWGEYGSWFLRSFYYDSGYRPVPDVANSNGVDSGGWGTYTALARPAFILPL